MKITTLINSRMLTLPAVLLFSFSVFAAPQDPAQQGDQQQRLQGDPISQLNLTPEQRQKIRAITQENRDERMRINRQLRDAQAALEQTLDADSPSEAAVEDRIRDLAAAQTAQIRMRSLTELRIRGVLTPDQIRTWRALRAERRNMRREGRSETQNGMSPLFPRNRRNALPLRRTP